MPAELMARKTGIEIVPAVFTDHHAVIHRITVPNLQVRIRRVRWKMDTLLMQDESLKGKIRTSWAK
jgi:hypothetical protein